MVIVRDTACPQILTDKTIYIRTNTHRLTQRGRRGGSSCRSGLIKHLLRQGFLLLMKSVSVAVAAVAVAITFRAPGVVSERKIHVKVPPSKRW